VGTTAHDQQKIRDHKPQTPSSEALIQVARLLALQAARDAFAAPPPETSKIAHKLEDTHEAKI
jgi:hypothetical protein